VKFSASGGGADDTQRYEHISRVLTRFDYAHAAKRERGVVLAYLRHTSGYSRAQTTRLVAIDWLPAIRQWHSEGLLDPTFADWGAIEQNIAAPVDHALARLRSERRGYVADAASEMSWWAMFHLPSSVAATDDRKYTWSSSLAARRPAKYDHAPSAREPVRPVVREQPKVGRNDPCPCGSGRKFKKYHGAA